MLKHVLMYCVLAMGLVSQTFAQDRIVTGKVLTSEDNSPLPGVSVAVKGTTKGAQTDINGTFKIAAANNATLIFSYIGFETKQVSLGSKTSIDVVLSPDTKTLSEVTITGAYGSYDKKGYTGARSQLGGKDIENRPFSSAISSLQGQVAGLQTAAFTGQPGANQNVRIRGIGSISAGADPLYVVDGTPINAGDFSNRTTSSSTLAGLNPNDIEEIGRAHV